MSNEYSRSALLEFLDYLANKGLANPGTVTARKVAANNLLNILDEEEASDLRKLDVDALMARFANLKGGGFTPGSLNTYKSRFGAALKDFLNYKNDPLSFKPGITQRARKSVKGKLKDSSTSIIQEESPAHPIHPSRDTHENIVFPIPIREGVTVKIAGLPSNLTKSEALKITNVISALAQIDAH